LSSFTHYEDGGTVHSSIRKDGRIIHWCDKCDGLWVSDEKPESELSKNVKIESRRALIEIKEAIKLSESSRARIE